MSTGIEKANKALIRQYMNKAFNTGNHSLFDQFFASNFVDHNGFPGQKPGPDGVRDSYVMWRDAFPDTFVTIEDLIAEDDKVVVYSTLRATHRGTFMNISPANETVLVRGISIFRIADGKIVERWGLTDAMGLVRQLGGVFVPRDGHTTEPIGANQELRRSAFG